MTMHMMMIIHIWQLRVNQNLRLTGFLYTAAWAEKRTFFELLAAGRIQ
jgi:hypothetical protein